MSKAFSWISTEVKMIMSNDAHKIADLLIDGCNMGIKSLSGYMNQYDSASEDSREMTRKLIRIEHEFMNDLLEYL